MKLKYVSKNNWSGENTEKTALLFSERFLIQWVHAGYKMRKTDRIKRLASKNWICWSMKKAKLYVWKDKILILLIIGKLKNRQ